MIALAVLHRDVVRSKKFNNELRANKKIPGVVYGGKENISVIVDSNKIVDLYNSGLINTEVIDLDVEGKKFKVLVRDSQWSPLTERAVHVDFWDISNCNSVKVDVPLRFIKVEESVPIKYGALLRKVIRSVKLECDVESIPSYVDIDVSVLKVGQSLRVDDLEIPEGTKLCMKYHSLSVLKLVGKRMKDTLDDDESPSEDEEESSKDN